MTKETVDNFSFWLFTFLFTSVLCLITICLSYQMKYNEEFKHLMFYEQEPNISEIKKRRRSWDIIDKDAILKRFDLK